MWRNAFIVCGIFSFGISVIVLQGCWETCFCWWSSGNVNLGGICWFFSFPPEIINHLLLCFWFPGSWLVLPRQNLNTAPLFSPQEQCLNVESIPTLTEDAQNWIWEEVGSCDVGTAGGNQKNLNHMASSPSANFKLVLKYWEGAISLSSWILNTSEHY